MIVGVTGHRDVLQKPGELDRFARLFVALSGAEKIISGMARGWDLAVAQACLDEGVPYVAGCPYPQQTDGWEPADRAKWLRCVNGAAEVRFLGGSPNHRLFLARNEWIVDRADEMASLYDGRHRGGTRHCILYAETRGIKVTPLWDRWQRFRMEGSGA